MQVHYNIEQLPAFKKAIITIGTFDGVHKGHQQIIDAMRKESKEKGGETFIITFDPHPRKIVEQNDSLQLINTLDEKISLLKDKGIDHLVVVPFNKEFAMQTAEEYVENFLVDKFHPQTIIIGYDHHFGKNRKGNFQLLEQLSDKFKYRLIEIPKQLLEKIAISSTKIRDAIKAGEIETANHLLGYSFFFEGIVIRGDQVGRQLGYPTANLSYTDEDKIHLGEGVYAVQVIVDKERKNGMLSIGKRPTLNDTIERIELNIFDFDADVYGEKLKVIVKKYIRSQVKFNSLGELKNQMLIDKQNALQALIHS
ncbi:MAG TPA: bifunctional riboflavin kinase/FAD synthetase [Chitinophagaceae bacterium]|nr:bifunctional riboflavin kinase/FAD synthetase [Chitinophagaceae bacterium]